MWILVKKKVTFLEYVILAEWIFMNPKKVKVVLKWEGPKSMMKISSFLGMTGYYQRFIERFTTIATLITQLSWKETKWEGISECENSFQKLKNRPTIALVLALPSRIKGFVNDVSYKGLGYVLMQHKRVIAFASR